jgi:NAD(P)-dependent dehydrogenase (short-subunit alcohol dehydrogenase family)
MVEELGSQAIAIEADVRSSAQMQAAVERAMAEFGRIDILCNNAGTCIIEAVDEITDASIDAIVDTNVKGIFNTIRYVAPIMKRNRSGVIINTASAAAMKAAPYLSVYCASKGAVMTATKSLARELAEWDIRVNGIAPGSVDTPMNDGLAQQLGLEPDEAEQRFGAGHVFTGARGKIEVGDISRMVVFLASESARVITGQTYAVDAGWSIS